MDEPYTSEWWLWRMYRCVATYVNDPSQGNEARLLGLIDDYRNHSSMAARTASTPGRHNVRSTSRGRC